MAQADVEEAKPTTPTSDEIATLTIDPALLVGLENRAPLAPMAPLGVSTLDETEPNGTPATANSIVGDSAVVEGNIFPNADVDYYAFTAQAGDKLYAAVMGSFSASGSNDSQLRLFDTDGTTLIEFDENDGTFGASSSTLREPHWPVGDLLFRGDTLPRQLRPYYLYFPCNGAPTRAEPTPPHANPAPRLGRASEPPARMIYPFPPMR